MNHVSVVKHKSKQKVGTAYSRRLRHHSLPKPSVRETDSHVVVTMRLEHNQPRKVRVMVLGQSLFIGVPPATACYCQRLYCRCLHGAKAKAVLKAVRLPRAVDSTAMVVQYLRGALRVMLPKEALA